MDWLNSIWTWFLSLPWWGKTIAVIVLLYILERIWDKIKPKPVPEPSSGKYAYIYCKRCRKVGGIKCPHCDRSDRIICINDPNDPNAFRTDTFGFKCNCGFPDVIVHYSDALCDECYHPKGECWEVRYK